MVQSNKVTPAVQDLQGVNILGSWTLTDTYMVRLKQTTTIRETSNQISQLSGAEVVDRWYQEACFHDYHSEAQNSRSGEKAG